MLTKPAALSLLFIPQGMLAEKKAFVFFYYGYYFLVVPFW